jgi:hypothetical protein
MSWWDGPDGLDRCFNGSRVARSIGDQQAIELVLLIPIEDDLPRCVVGDDLDMTPALCERLCDAPLVATIEQEDPRAITAPGALFGIVDSDTIDEVLPGHARGAGRHLDELGVGERCVVGDDPPHGPEGPKAARQCARVHALNGQDAIVAEVITERIRRCEIAVAVGEFPADEPGDLDAPGLGVVGIDAIVADHRGGHDEDLPGVGGVGQGLLIAGHGGVEDDLSGC